MSPELLAKLSCDAESLVCWVQKPLPFQFFSWHLTKTLSAREPEAVPFPTFSLLIAYFWLVEAVYLRWIGSPTETRSCLSKASTNTKIEMIVDFKWRGRFLESNVTNKLDEHSTETLNQFFENRFYTTLVNEGFLADYRVRTAEISGGTCLNGQFFNLNGTLEMNNDEIEVGNQKRDELRRRF